MAIELVLFILFLVLVFLISRHFRVNHLLPPSPLALPIIGHFHLLSPLIHRSFHDLSLRLGPVYSLRLGSVPCVVVSSPEVAKEFLKTHELSFMNRTANIAAASMTYNASFAFASYGPYWKFVRKLSTNELLSSLSVDKFLPIRNQEYVRLLRLLAKKAEACEPVNLSEELPKVGHNIMGKMMLGKYSNDSRAARFRVVVRECTKIFGEFNFSDFNWIWKKFDVQGFQKRIDATHNKFDALVEEIIDEREELRKMKTNGGNNTGAEEKDVMGFLEVLLDKEEECKSTTKNFEVDFSRNHVKGLITVCNFHHSNLNPNVFSEFVNFQDMFTASIDTTSITMEWALAEVINHPEVLKKAREEMDRAVGTERLVGEWDLPNLPYIQAILKETLRLHPPLPIVPRICTEECKVGKYVFPEKTLLFVNTWAMGRDPKNWENPLEFRPERFLQLDGSDPANGTDVRGQHYHYLPFGSGRRICPGLTLTMKMLPTQVAVMIQCFDFKIGGTQCENTSNDKVLEMDEGPGLTVPRASDLVCFPIARFSSLLEYP
uniref:licodione synthase-like n=1 Tax=Fragaria vesca subsp. vesca TaxID=101020 RepID=UPI0005CA8AAD|nr:PREDICTED: licodione synthase-like [Fragaria vesca subsp. vesca]